MDAQKTVGGILRAAREFRGLSLQDLADATRIRRAYVAALEEMRLDQLPSRPFAIGYVRACAVALHLDPDDLVARFKQQFPADGDGLRAPIGVAHERDPRLSLVAGGAGIVLCAVLVWNLAQHANAGDGAPTPAVPETIAPRPAPAVTASGPVVLSATQPAPRESEVPEPYVTPGLEASAGAVTADAKTAPAAAALPPASPVFSPRGAIYGAAADQSMVTLQAMKSATLVIRGGDGAVYFARQLAAGEAYRAPIVKGLTAEVSDAAAFSVYAAGQLKGPLPATQASLSSLAG